MTLLKTNDCHQHTIDGFITSQPQYLIPQYPSIINIAETYNCDICAMRVTVVAKMMYSNTALKNVQPLLRFHFW